LASWTLIILFSEMLKFSKIISSKSKKKIVKENSEYLRIFHLLKLMFQFYLFIYLTDMCWNGQGPTVFHIDKTWKSHWVSDFHGNKKNQSFKRFRLMPVHLVPFWVDYGKVGIHAWG
jgi:hypothetical protein